MTCKHWQIFSVLCTMMSYWWEHVTADLFIFTRVGTYVQRGSKFCFVLLGVRVIAQNIALLSNFTMHSAVVPGSLARQPCPAAFPGSLARQPCPAALPSSHAPAALPGSSTNFVQFRPDLMRALAHSAVTALYYSGRSPNCMRALLSWQV
jgi:hypothetical protein